MTSRKNDEATRYIEPSLVKQRLYSSYAKGEITRQKLAHEINNIQPPEPNVSWKYRVAASILMFIVTLFLPPSAKRNN